MFMKRATGLLPDEMVESVARRFRLLGEPARLRLLQLLETQEYSVNELAEKLQGNQANVSRHLTALYEGGLLKRRPEGTSVYYSVADPMVGQLCDLVCKNTEDRMRTQLNALNSAAARGRKRVVARSPSRTTRHAQR